MAAQSAKQQQRLRAQNGMSVPDSFGVVRVCHSITSWAECALSAVSLRRFAPTVKQTQFVGHGLHDRIASRALDKPFASIMAESVDKIVTLPKGVTGFAMKLLALADSPYERTLYMDCDTTVHTAAFARIVKEQIEGHELVLVHDWPWKSRYTTPIAMFSTGIFGYHTRHPVVRRLLHNAHRRWNAGEFAECDAALRRHIQHFDGDRLPASIVAADRRWQWPQNMSRCRHSDQEAIWSELASNGDYVGLRTTFLPAEFHCPTVRPDRAIYHNYYDCLATHYHGSDWPCGPLCNSNASAQQVRELLLGTIQRLQTNKDEAYCDASRPGPGLEPRYPPCLPQSAAVHMTATDRTVVLGDRQSDDSVVALVQQCGLGNRLTMLGRAFAFAVSKNVSIVRTFWVPDARWPAAFSTVFNAHYARGPRHSFVDVDLQGPKPHWTPNKRNMYTYDPLDHQRWPVLKQAEAVVRCANTLPSSRGSCVVSGCDASLPGAVISALDRDSKLRDRFRRGCRAMLQAVRPVPWVKKVVSAHLPSGAIGVHIRGKDTNLSFGRRLSQTFSECSPPEAMAEVALRREGQRRVVAFVAAGAEGTAERFRAALRRGAADSWTVLTAYDLLRLANQTSRLPKATWAIGNEPASPPPGDDTEQGFLREELVALVDMWALASTARLYRPPMSTLSRAAAVWKHPRPAVVNVFDASLPGCALQETLNGKKYLNFQNGALCHQREARVVRCEHASFDDICDPRTVC